MIKCVSKIAKMTKFKGTKVKLAKNSVSFLRNVSFFLCCCWNTVQKSIVEEWCRPPPHPLGLELIECAPKWLYIFRRFVFANRQVGSYLLHLCIEGGGKQELEECVLVGNTYTHTQRDGRKPRKLGGKTNRAVLVVRVCKFRGKWWRKLVNCDFYC